MGCHVECTQISHSGATVKNESPLLGKVMGHECPRCHKEVELPLGELCADCRAHITARARKISRIVALGTTLPFALYVYVRLPQDQTLRLVGVSTVVVWYIIVGLVTKRVLMEVLK